MLGITKISTIIVIFYILMYSQAWGNNFVILYGASLVIVLSMLINWFMEKKVELKNVPFGIWNNLIMIVFSLITGVFVAYNYSSLLKSCITYAAFAIVCVAICYVSATEKSFSWLFNTLIITAVICGIVLLAKGTEWKGYGRTLNSRNNPHTLAAVMNLGIFSVAYKCVKHDIKELFFSGLFILFFLFIIIECGSRKYLIVSLFIVLIWGLTYSSSIWKKRDSNQRIILILCVGSVALLGILYYINIYSNSFIHSRMNDTDDSGNINRVNLYRYAFKIFLERPFLGGGFDQFKYWSGTGGYAHSTYAEALADFGFIGCLLYFSPILHISYKIIRQAVIKREYKDRLLLAFCISELFIGVGQIFFMEFYLFIAWTILFSNGGRLFSGNTDKDQDLKKKEVCKYLR